MKRETITITEDFINNLIKESHVDGFSIIEHDQQTHDPDDGNLVTFVVRREVDSKFFAGDYNYWSSDQSFDDFSEELEEVFPKQVITTIYE